MANVDNPSGFSPHRRLGGGALQTFTGLLASNTIYEAGDILQAEAGYVTIATAATDAVAGVAQSIQATSLGTHPTAYFYPAIQDYVFTAQCSGTPTQATIWTLVDFEGTTGIMEINEDASTIDHMRAIGFESNTSIGLNAKMEVIFAKSVWAQTASA